MASIGTMSAAPPKADKPITLAKPESPSRKPTELSQAMADRDDEFFKPDSPSKDVVQTTFWSRPMMAFDDDPVLSGPPVKLKAAPVADDGEMKAGEANGYGTVAVDLAAEAEKAKETMKALRKAQMDKPPPVAMKKNPITGEMEKFESEALKDDLPEEEAETGDIEIPVGDDY